MKIRFWKLHIEFDFQRNTEFESMEAVSTESESSNPLVRETKLEQKLTEAMKKRAAKGSHITSFNGIIMKFQIIDDSLRNCKEIFAQFDENSDGAIDRRELKTCFEKLEISFTEKEIDDLFNACEIGSAMGIEYNEFIVLLCLVYLLKNDPASKTQIVMPKLEPAFETLVDAFVFLDKNKDGHVSKEEMILAVHVSGECSSRQIAIDKFEEMDCDKNGVVSFKEFLYAFTHWVDLDN